MRAYLIDEIGNPDMEKIKGFLTRNAIKSRMNGIFWVKVPADFLSEPQHQHEACQPHVFAVELGAGFVKLEFYIRSLTNMRCICPGLCTPAQRDFIIRFADGMVDQLHIRT
jgi:hypothetical protein